MSPSACPTIPFFMDSRNSGTAPAGHIQIFDWFFKGSLFQRGVLI